MPAAIDEPVVANEPKAPIDVKRMSSKFQTAMKEGAIPTPEAKAPESPLMPEPVKAPESPAEPKGEIPVPKLKAPEPPKPEPAKATEPHKPIPSSEFKKLETARDEFKTKWEAAEAKAKEIEAKLSTAIDPNTVKELEGKLEKANKQADEYKEFVDKFYLENSPSFRKAYNDRIEASIEEAKEAVGGEVGDQLEKAFRMSPSKARDEEIEKLSEELSNFKQGAVIKAYSELKRLQREREGELKNSKENIKKLQEYETQQTQARNEQFAKSIKSTFTNELGVFESAMDGFKPIEGNNDYNAIVKQNKERAEQFLASDPSVPVNRARLALWASYGIHANQLVSAQAEKIAKLEKQLGDVQAANPSVRGGIGTKAETGETKDGDKPGTRTVSRFREAMEKGVPAKE